jgi:hypothetical protein
MKGILAVVVFLYSLCMLGQTAEKYLLFDQTPLPEAFQKLETTFDVRLAYNPLHLPHRKLTLSGYFNWDSLKIHLEQDLGISISLAGGNYYVVKTQKRDICVKVLASESERPVFKAHIRPTLESSVGFTNSEGIFEGNFSLTDTLEISHMGYTPLKVAVTDLITDTPCSTIPLETQIFQLDGIVLKKQLAKGIRMTPGQGTHMDVGSLEALSGLAEPDVLAYAQVLPGVESPSESATDLFVRGGSPDQNLILWDGIKMYNSSHFFGMISAFNPYIVTSSTLQKNGAAPKYGDRVSAVIDVRSDTIIPKKISGGLGLNTIHADAYIKLPLAENWGLLLSGRRSYTDIYKSDRFKAMSEKVFQNTRIGNNKQNFDPSFSSRNEDFYFFDSNFKLIGKIGEKNQLNLSGIWAKNKLDYSFEYTEPPIKSADMVQSENFGANAQLKTQWSPSLRGLSSFYRTTYYLDYATQDENSSNQVIQTTLRKNRVDELGGGFALNKKFRKNRALESGLQWVYNQVNYYWEERDFGTNDVEESNTSLSLYQQLNLNDLKGWHLDIGYRFAWHSSVSHFTLEPRLNLNKQLGKNLVFKLAGEFKKQTVRQVIEFTSGSHYLQNQIWVLSDEGEVPLLKSRQLSLGLNYTPNTWNLDLDLYGKRITGLTSYTRGINNPDGLFSYGESDVWGVDVIAKKSWGNFFSLMTYSLTYATSLFNGLNGSQRFDSSNSIPHSFHWSNSLSLKPFEFSLGWQIRSGTPYTELQQVNFSIPENNSGVVTEYIYGPINAKRLPVYHRLDLSARYHFKLSERKGWGNYTLGLALQNLYDRVNILNRTYEVIPTTIDGYQITEGYYNQLDELSIGFNPSLVFRWEF